MALYENWDTVKAKAAELKKAISEKWNEIKQVTIAVFTSIKDFLNNIWNGIKTDRTTSINSAKNIVKKAVDFIYSFFKNLRIPEIRIPKIKLPHFSLRGEFSLIPPKVQKFDVNWYA